MAAAKYDFEIDQGATFDKSFVWKNSSGVPINLTGYSARMQIRRAVSEDEVLIELTTNNSRINIISLQGVVRLKISPVDTAAMSWSRGVYDLELVAPDGYVTRLLKGTVTISKEVTR
jgi:hypothetical protein